MGSERLAITGHAPTLIPFGNLGQWVFTSPYREDGEIFRDMQSRRGQEWRSPITVPNDKPIVVNPFTKSTLTLQRAREDSLRIGASFKQLGIAAGNDPDNVSPPIILLHLPNCLMYNPLLFGALAIGLTVTMANPALTRLELEWILQSSRPSAVVTTCEGYKIVNEAIARLDNAEYRESLSRSDRIFVVDISKDDYCGVDQPSKSIPAGATNWKALLESAPLESALPLTSEQSRKRPAIILWSSGTSGKSKGVLLSHRSVICNANMLWEKHRVFCANERWLGFIPFYHVFGLGALMTLGTSMGATVYPVPKFDPDLMLELIPKLKITYLHIAPPVAMMLAKSPKLEGVDMSSVNGAMSGGAPLGGDAIGQVYRRLGVMTTIGYGSSEGMSISHAVPDTWKEYQPYLGSIGNVLEGVEVKITSLEDTKKIQPLLTEGEIVIRSPTIMLGYLNNQEATAEALDEDGWLHSGDVGKMDRNRYLWITGRAKEVLKVKGFQVSPPELDATLCASPHIADAAVSSVYDDDEGTELPRAYIVPAKAEVLKCCEPQHPKDMPLPIRELADHVKSWTEERLINYKWLRGNLVFIKEVPKNPTGKILRRLLKDTQGIQVDIYPKKSRVTASKL